MYTTNEKEDAEMITVVKDLVEKAGFSGGIKAWVHSYGDTLPGDDVIHELKYLTEIYNRDTALFHIACLMNQYGIKEVDLKNYLQVLKGEGWPNPGRDK